MQFIGLAALVACTARQTAPIDSARPGDRIATIPAARVDVLEIVKADPQSGDRWSVDLRRAHPSKAPAFQWEIHAEPPLPDPRADGDLIRHLLDSLEAAKIAGVPRASPLEATGLKPPRFALRWSAASGTEEVEVGAPATEPGQAYARVPRLSASRAVKVQGSLLALLGELSSFERLRQRSWSDTAADDFDELELKRKGKTVLYAQRGRDRWTDRNDQPVKRDAARILTALVTTPIREFLDAPAVSKEALGSISRAGEYQAVLTDREGVATTLTIARPDKGPSVTALSSARPTAPFKLDRTVLEAWSF